MRFSTLLGAPTGPDRAWLRVVALATAFAVALLVVCGTTTNAKAATSPLGSIGVDGGQALAAGSPVNSEAEAVADAQSGIDDPPVPLAASTVINFAQTPGFAAFEAAHPFSAASPPASIGVPFSLSQPGAAPTAAQTRAAVQAAPAYTAGFQGFGIGDATGQFLNYHNKSTYETFQSRLNMHYVRFFIDWDAFGTSLNGSTCTDNGTSGNAYTAAQTSAQFVLYESLDAAKLRGLTPLIALTMPSPLSPDVPGETSPPSAIHGTLGFEALVDDGEVIWVRISSQSIHRVHEAAKAVMRAGIGDRHALPVIVEPEVDSRLHTPGSRHHFRPEVPEQRVGDKRHHTTIITVGFDSGRDDRDGRSEPLRAVSLRQAE
jgi:hypothetical protein